MTIVRVHFHEFRLTPRRPWDMRLRRHVQDIIYSSVGTTVANRITELCAEVGSRRGAAHLACATSAAFLMRVAEAAAHGSFANPSPSAPQSFFVCSINGDRGS